MVNDLAEGAAFDKTVVSNDSQALNLPVPFAGHNSGEVLLVF